MARQTPVNVPWQTSLGTRRTFTQPPSDTSDGTISLNCDNAASPTVWPSKRVTPGGRCARPVQLSEKKTIIIDLGHYFIRAGFLRTQPAKPDICLPNVIAGDSPSEIAVGEDVLRNVVLGNHVQGYQSPIVFPLRQKQITGPTYFGGIPTEKYILREIIKRLKVDPKEYKVLICLPTRASALRTGLFEFLLGPASVAEEFGGVNAVATISAFRAALQTAKAPTCLVVCIGADLEIVPIVEGSLVEKGRSSVVLYGEHALNAMLMDVVEAGIDLSPEEIACYGPFIFQKAAFINNTETDCTDIVIDLSEFAPCPTERKLYIPAELRQRATEGMLRPEQNLRFDGNSPSLKRLLRKAVKACDFDFRHTLCSNILLMGDFASIEGLRVRVAEEVQSFLPRGVSAPRVRVAPSAEEAVYDGACLLSALLQGPRAPACPWFRFLDAHDWARIRADTLSNGKSTHTRLLQRLNEESIWP
uniref:Miff domain-containing protein n=1 Tax=Mesocestoides corti TaxID=53468 RepID=A0A5K3ERN8_MESCO